MWRLNVHLYVHVRQHRRALGGVDPCDDAHREFWATARRLPTETWVRRSEENEGVPRYLCSISVRSREICVGLLLSRVQREEGGVCVSGVDSRYQTISGTRQDSEQSDTKSQT